MPSTPQPKTFVAARAFRYGGKTYAKGDPVEDRRSIDRLVRYGTRFIAHKPAKAEPPAEPVADEAPTTESPKED